LLLGLGAESKITSADAEDLARIEDWIISDDMSDTLLAEELKRSHFLLRIESSNDTNDDLKVSELLSTMLSTPLKSSCLAARHHAVAECCHRSCAQSCSYKLLRYKLDRMFKIVHDLLKTIPSAGASTVTTSPPSPISKTNSSKGNPCF
jgi:hypothetical protein